MGRSEFDLLSIAGDELSNSILSRYCSEKILFGHRPTQTYPVESRHGRVCFAEVNRASTDRLLLPVDLTGEKLSALRAQFF
jgi:hypothetical protein